MWYVHCADHYGTDVHVTGSHPYPNGPGNFLADEILVTFNAVC